MTIYDGYQTWNQNEYPTILAIGDSWFWYPRNNLLEALAKHAKLKSGYEHMVCLGKNGATMSDYVDLPGRPGRFGRRLRELLQQDPMQYIAVFALSGAGNDAVDYSLGLDADCSGATTPGDCVTEGGLPRLTGEIVKAVSLLMHEVLWAFQTQPRQPTVLLHGYDYAVPDGRGFTLAGLPFGGPWLALAMDRRSVPPDLQLRKGIVKLMINEINIALKRYENPAAGIHFIDSRNTLDSGAGYLNDWDNELHPTRAGFDKIVGLKWIPLLQQLGIAKA
jgi:hypothetical protein